MLMLISSSGSSSSKLMAAACLPNYSCLLWQPCLIHLQVSSSEGNG